MPCIFMDMTNTTSATWNRNIEASITGMDDSAYGTFRGGRSYYYNHRDAKGRFVKATHVDHVETDNLPMWNAGNKGHANERCAATHGTPVPVTLDQADWLCPVCVHVPSLDHAAGAASKSGHMVCECCEQELPVTKFPTFTVHGVTDRRGVCRVCRDANVTPRGSRA